jgi:glycosyltransferase involved in cell wall biosynthesis
VFVHNLAQGLLRAHPEVELTMVTHPGDSHVMEPLRRMGQGRVEVLPQEPSHPLRQWFRVWDTVQDLFKGARQRFLTRQSETKTLIRRGVRGLWRSGPIGKAAAVAILPAWALGLWANVAVQALGRSAVEILTYPLVLVDRALRQWWGDVLTKIDPVEAQHLMQSSGCDVWIVPYVGFEYPIRVPSVLFVHDLVTFHFPEMFEGMNITRLREVVEARAQEATLCGCMSNFILRNDLLGYLKLPREKTRMVPPAPPTDLVRISPERANALRPARLQRPFLFLPSAFRGYKGHAKLIEALAILRERHGMTDLDLVFTGSAPDVLPPKLATLVARHRLHAHVHVLGRLDRETLAALYAHAEAMVTPTLYEQGSFPIYEALVCGCPVACSDIPALREQCAAMGDAILYFQPEDAADIAHTVARLRKTRDVVLWRQQRAAPLMWARTWDEAAARWLAVLEEAADLGLPAQASRQSASRAA